MVSGKDWFGWTDQQEKSWFILKIWKSYFDLLQITYTRPQNNGDE